VLTALKLLDICILDYYKRMVKNKCEDCGKKFTTIQSLDYHMNNKVCKKANNTICEYCHNEYSSASCLNRHKKSCKRARINKDEDDIDKIFNELIDVHKDKRLLKAYDMMVKMKEENENLKVKVIINNKEGDTITNNTTNNYNNSTINNGIVNNIYLVGYGKEDMDRIDRLDLLKVFRTGFNSPLMLTETMHFNPKYPEFHNVYIPSMKDKYAMIYDGSEWNMVTKEYLIDKLYDNKRDYIEENLEEFLNSLTNSQKKALQRWMKAEENHPYIAKIKDDIKLLLYNKRKLPLDNKKTSIISCHEEDIEIQEPNIHKVYVVPKTDCDQSEEKLIVVKKDNNGSIKSKYNGISPRKGTKRKVIPSRLS